MVAVYRGFDNLISKDVSVKTLLHWKASNAALLVQILKEVALAQVVTHPNLRRLLSNTGAAKLSDYGVASTTREQLRGAPQAGTLPYMAPEQLRGERVDARIDLYAAGMMAFEFLTGGFPFALTSSDAVNAIRLSLRGVIASTHTVRCAIICSRTAGDPDEHPRLARNPRSGPLRRCL